MTTHEYGELFLPAPVNEQANRLVITSIAQYPQTNEAAWLIANAAISEFATVRTGIGLPELARMRPDAEFATPIVHEIHRKFGIRSMSEPPGITEAISGILYDTFTFLGDATFDAARTTRVQPPDLDISNFYKLYRSNGDNSGILAVDSLHAYLGSTPLVQETVRHAIATRANHLRADSKRRKEEVSQFYGS